MTTKAITVFCSARELSTTYTQPATLLVQKLASSGYNLVWGGSDKGLMKKIADTAQECGREIHGVTIDAFLSVARKNTTSMTTATSLASRKLQMLEMGDIIVVLVGGVGTLDELGDVLELKKQGKHTKPIVLNTNHFYDGLKMQFEKMQIEGFMHVSLEKMVYFADTPEDALHYLHITL